MQSPDTTTDQTDATTDGTVPTDPIHVWLAIPPEIFGALRSGRLTGRMHLEHDMDHLDSYVIPFAVGDEDDAPIETVMIRRMRLSIEVSDGQTAPHVASPS